MKQSTQGYWYVADAAHPFAMCDNYVPEHRVVMERILGRLIDPRKEHVHHKDKNPANNHPDNLEVVPISDHNKLDKGWKKIDGHWHKPCRTCGGFFRADKHFYVFGDGKYSSPCKPCSRRKCLDYYHRRKARRQAA